MSGWAARWPLARTTPLSRYMHSGILHTRGSKMGFGCVRHVGGYPALCGQVQPCALRLSIGGGCGGWRESLAASPPPRVVLMVGTRRSADPRIGLTRRVILARKQMMNLLRDPRYYPCVGSECCLQNLASNILSESSAGNGYPAPSALCQPSNPTLPVVTGA